MQMVRDRSAHHLRGQRRAVHRLHGRLGRRPGLYVTVPCADGKRASTGRILAYKLGGDAKLPPASGPKPIPEPPPRQPMGEAEFAQAGALFARHCGCCHTAGPFDSGILPNLTRSSAETFAVWNGIVIGGAYKDKGMISFSHVLDIAQSEQVKAFVIETAHLGRAARAAAP